MLMSTITYKKSVIAKRKDYKENRLQSTDYKDRPN